MKQKETTKDTILDLLLIVSGCIFYGWSMIYLVNIPTIPGNLMGIASVCNSLFDWPVGMVNMILSVPTLMIGTVVLGKRMLAYTAFTMIGLSFITDLFTSFFQWEPGGNYLLLTIISASIMGVGCGLILYAGGTTGGTTILGRLLNRKVPQIALGNLLIAMDGMILIGGAIVLHNIASLFYSIIFEIICCRMIDFVISLLCKFLPARW